MAIIYVDPENGNDSNSGLSFALRKKTLSNATTSRSIGDEIRVMGYPDQLLGPAEWKYSAIRDPQTLLSINQVVPQTNSRITFSNSPSTAFSVGDYVCISNAISTAFPDPNTGYSQLNGVWRILTVVNNSTYELEGLTLTGTTLNVANIAQAGYATGAVVPLVGQYATNLARSSRWQYNIVAAPPPPPGPPPPPPPPPTITWPTYTLANGFQGIYSANSQISGTTTDVTYGTPVSFGPGSHWRITTTASTASVDRFVYDSTNVTSIATMTQGQNGNVDDTWYTHSIPFTVSYLGVNYTSAHIGSNSYVTFGSGSNAYAGLSASNPQLPKIMIGAADNSFQRTFSQTKGSAGSRTFHIRFEGTASTGGTIGSPNIVWEVIFYEATPNQIDLIVVTHNRYTTGGGSSPPPPPPPGGTVTAGVGTYFSTNYDPVGDLTSVGIATTSIYPVVAYNTFPAPLDLSEYDTVSFFTKFVGGTFPTVGTIDLALCSDTLGETPVYTIPIRSDITTVWTSATTVSSSYNWVVHRKIFGSMTTPVQSLAIRVTGNTSVTLQMIFGGIVAGKNGLSAGVLIGRDPSIKQQAWLLANTIEYKYGKTLILSGGALQGNNQSLVARRATGCGHVGLYTDAINAGITTANAYLRTPILQTPVTSSNASSNNINSNSLKISGGWNRTDMSTQDGYTVYNGVNCAGIGININTRSNLTFDRIGAIQFYDAFYFLNTYRFGLNDVEASYCVYSGLRLQTTGYATIENTRCTSGNFNFYGHTAYNFYLKNSVFGPGGQGIILNTNNNSCHTVVVEKCLIRNVQSYSLNSQSATGTKFISTIVDGCLSNYNLYFVRSYDHDFHNLGYHNHGVIGPYYNSVGNINYFIPYCTSTTLHSNVQAASVGTLPRSKYGVTITGYSSGGPVVSSALTGSPVANAMTTKYYNYTLYTLTGQTLPNSTTGQVLRYYAGSTDGGASPRHAYEIPLCQGIIPANVQSTFSVYVKKSSNTIAVFATVEGPDDLGTSEIYTTSSILHNTNWQQLSINVTPTKTGLAKFILKIWTNASGGVVDIWGQSIT